MNQYIKFIVRVLLTCFFIAFLGGIIQVLCGLEPVSYTHLDVYKRQVRMVLPLQIHSL